MRKIILLIFSATLLTSIISCGQRTLSEEQQKEINSQLADAVKENDVRTAAKLLRKGADADSLSYEGTSVLHMAIYKKNLDMVELLIEEGADVMFPVDNQLDPLMIAVEAQQHEIAKALIEAGADVNHINNDRVNSTALMHAAFLNDVEMCQILVENGADLNLVSYYKFPAVGWASQNRAMDTTRFLVEAGADLSLIVSFYGEQMNLLDVAIEQGDTEIEAYLRSVGMTPSVNEE